MGANGMLFILQVCVLCTMSTTAVLCIYFTCICSCAINGHFRRWVFILRGIVFCAVKITRSSVFILQVYVLCEANCPESEGFGM